MKKVLISIISEQTIPNYFFIKEYQHQIDEYIFFSTTQMEEKKITDYLIDTLKSIKRQNIILIDANDGLKIYEKLNTYQFDKNSRYIINATGGNKLMSMVITDFFKNHFKTEIYYTPIHSSENQQIHPEFKSIAKKEIVISLADYLELHGYTIFSQSELSNFHPKPEKIFSDVCKQKDPSKINYLADVYTEGFSSSKKPYLTGGWFEEYLYHYYKEKLQLNSSQIAFGVKVKNKNAQSESDNDNEFDCMFIFKNELYIIEAKVYRGIIKGNKISEPMYKISSLGSQFGLTCKRILITIGNVSDDENMKSRIEDLCSFLKIQCVLFIDDFINDNVIPKTTQRNSNRNITQIDLKNLFQKFNTK